MGLLLSKEVSASERSTKSHSSSSDGCLQIARSDLSVTTTHVTIQDRAAGRRFPVEILVQILSDIGVSDDGSLWLYCRPVCKDFKVWVEEIYFKEYVPFLQLHTLVHVQPSSSSSTSAANLNIDTGNSNADASYHHTTGTFRDPITTTTHVIQEKPVQRQYKVSRTPHLDSSRIIFELVKPRPVPSNTHDTITTTTTNHHGLTTSASLTCANLSTINSFHHFTRAASSLCGPYSTDYIGYYAVGWCEPNHNAAAAHTLHHRFHERYRARRDLQSSPRDEDGIDRSRLPKSTRHEPRYHEHHQHGTSSHWSFGMPSPPSPPSLHSREARPQDEPSSSSSSSSSSDMKKGKEKRESKRKCLPIVRSDFAGRVADGEFLEVDWRTLVGQSCRVRETHWLVDWGTDLRIVEGDDSGGAGSASGSGQGRGTTGDGSVAIGRVKAKRARMVLWCAYGGLLVER